MQKWRSRMVLGAKLALAGGLLAWLVGGGRLDIGRLRAVPFSAELGVFFAAILLSLLVPVIRWWSLLRIQELPVPLSRVLALTWMGYFTNLLLPGGMGGDIAKGYLLVHGREDGRTRAVSTVLADRAIGLYALLFLGSLSGLWLAATGSGSEAGQMMAQVAGLMLGGLTLGAVALWWGPTRGLLFRILPARLRYTFQQSSEFYVRRTAALAGCFCLALVNSACTLLALALAADFLTDGSSSWSSAFLAGPLVIVANSVPLTPGGLGVGEAASNALFSPFGITVGAEIMVLYRLSHAVLSLPGLALMLMPLRKPTPVPCPETAAA